MSRNWRLDHQLQGGDHYVKGGVLRKRLSTSVFSHNASEPASIIHNKQDGGMIHLMAV